MPLPLYGSGLRCERMYAAIWPTSSLSAPKTPSRVGVSTRNSIPLGGSTSTGCEYPSASTSFAPWSWARYPTPEISRFFVNPLVAGPEDAQLAILTLELHLGMQLALERAERTLDRQPIPLLRHLHARRERD